MEESVCRPRLSYNGLNEEILLAEDPVLVSVSDSSCTGVGRAFLRFLPSPRIEIRITSDKVPGLAFFESNSVSILVKNRNLSIPGFVTKFTVSTKEVATFSWRPKNEPIIARGDDRTSINSVIFHVFNFKSFFGTSRSMEKQGNVSNGIQHLDLTAEDWRVELRSLPSTEKTVKQLEEEGGFGLTHIGRFEKAGHSPFTGRQAREMLKALRFFFSFARGMWCEPVCAFGLDNRGNSLWECWSSPSEPWKMPYSWFDEHNGEQLAALFPGFLNRWLMDNWRKAIHDAIYWYVLANQWKPIDAGIILTQAAIELLSYELAVKDKRLLVKKEFKDKRASEKFRLLFSTLGIPLDIPAETPELQRLASNSQMNWRDAPHALTEIRNSLVHPEHKHSEALSASYFEAWNLGLWYLEMSILGICGYTGTYGNRLKHRQVEEVPWQK